MEEEKEEEQEEDQAVSLSSCLTFLLESAEKKSFETAAPFVSSLVGQGSGEARRGAAERAAEGAAAEAVVGGGGRRRGGKGSAGDPLPPSECFPIEHINGSSSSSSRSSSNNSHKENNNNNDNSHNNSTSNTNQQPPPPSFLPSPPSLSRFSKKGASNGPYQFTEDGLRDVMTRLLSDEVLSDEVLNRALDMLAKQPQSHQLVLFNTFWYEKIKEGKYNDAKAWLARALNGRPAGGLRLICVPINISNAHWVLVFADLERNTVQEWDPASKDSPLDPSRVKNVKDAVEKVLEFEKLNRRPLRVVPAPERLPQQSDVVNCGLFVVLYMIQICFLRKPPSEEWKAAHEKEGPEGGREERSLMRGALTHSSSSDDASDHPLFGDNRVFPSPSPSTFFVPRATRSHGGLGLPPSRSDRELIPSCMFRVSKEDLFRYRVFLLAWILHSQTSHFAKTDPLLLSFIQEERRELGGEGDGREQQLQQQQDVLPRPLNLVLGGGGSGREGGVGKRGGGGGRDGRIALRDQRKVLNAVVKDTLNSEPMQRKFLEAAMLLLNSFTPGNDGEGGPRVVFVGPEWYRCLVEGRKRAANKIIEALPMGEVEVLVMPLYHPGAGGWVLARVNLMDELKCVYLHGTHALGEAAAILSNVEEGLREIFEGEHKMHWHQRTELLEDVPYAYQVPVALVTLAMHTSRDGLDGLGGGRGGGGGKGRMSGKELRFRFDRQENYFAMKIGVIRWLLRHTDRA